MFDGLLRPVLFRVAAVLSLVLVSLGARELDHPLVSNVSSTQTSLTIVTISEGL